MYSVVRHVPLESRPPRALEKDQHVGVVHVTNRIAIARIDVNLEIFRHRIVERVERRGRKLTGSGRHTIKALDFVQCLLPIPDSALYLDKSEEVDRFLTEISDVKELALDTEGASFHRFLDRIYLLQLSTRERSAIIDPASHRITRRTRRASPEQSRRSRFPRRRLRSAPAASGLRLARHEHLRHADRVAAAGNQVVRPRRAAGAVLRRQAGQEAPARRLVDAPAHARTCSTTPRRTRATCCSSRIT